MKGLKFTPTPEKQNVQELQSDLSEFHRKLRLKEFFYSNPRSTEDDSLVRNKSNFQPPKGRNQPLEQFCEVTNTLPSKQSTTNMKHNISLAERNAIRSLQNDKTIVIKEADKGGGIVIMNSEFYEKKILEMLNDNTFYQRINENHSKITFKKIKDLIKLNVDMTRHEIDYLLNFEHKSSRFYGLPKIHKCKSIADKCLELNSEYIEINDPPDLKFRPIIAGPACETHRLSNLIDILLKPFTSKIQSYVRDDIDFLTHIPETASKESYLTSFDVTSLYTNISHKLGLEAISYWLNKFPNLIHKRFTKEFILEGIKVILENNNFSFDDKTYNQIKGTAMGTKFAPTYATLVLGYLEEELYTKLENTHGQDFALYIKQNWKRFLDDCFIIWIKSLEELKQFHTIINELHPDISFTVEYDITKLPFLDILMIKENGKITTDIYFKDTDSKQYLNFQSCHPRHTKTSIPYNLARRICTIVSDNKTRNIRLGELTTALKRRGFPRSLIKSGIEKALSIPRQELLKTKSKQQNQDTIAYVSTQNPLNPELFRNIHNNLFILQSNETMNAALQGTTLIKSKRQPLNLKKLLTRAKFVRTQSLENKVTKCNRSNCSLCQHIIENTFIKFGNKKFYVNESMSCDVKNVIYAITCNGCREQYIGQTGDKLRTRRTVHAQQIRDPSTRQIPLSKHLDECSNSEPKFEMFPFYKLKTESTAARLIKEKHFIEKFRPKLNALH